MVIVDTDVLVDVFRRYAPAVEWLEKTVAEDEVILPGYVVMELIQGARNREEQERMRRTEVDAVLWPSEDTCNQATELLAKHHLSSDQLALSHARGVQDLKHGPIPKPQAG